MSIHTKFYIHDKVYNVLEYEFSINQNIDYNNRPCAKPLFAGLEMVIEASKDTLFFEEALKSYNLLQCRLVRTPVAMNGKSHTLHLIDAIVIKSTTIYKADGTTPFAEKIQITAAGLKDSNSPEEYSAGWRVTPLLTEQAAEEEVEDNEPRITRQYITDQEDVVLDEYQQGDQIYYVIESENMVGEAVDIVLNNKDDDFVYKGKRLANDKITNYIIEADIEKIPLEVVSENNTNQ
ncbi:type VI secretion system tube protein TssD [Aquimarina algicola]|uniref:Uncharacterized protein n=1 Tax=Aquimarina algicola TaxID=2589995 RepID=A0A504JDE0_9FLAO|nr:type VI secretion system tube protein TssD [Aquimarina algicola]TPN84381.1 hypothetical protein FHK87_15705 [Aquimarina algicola]